MFVVSYISAQLFFFFFWNLTYSIVFTFDIHAYHVLLYIISMFAKHLAILYISLPQDNLSFKFQGSSNFSPTLRMVNVHDGLYYIHSQPLLSALQSFSIAVATIHSRSPSLRPSSQKLRLFSGHNSFTVS